MKGVFIFAAITGVFCAVFAIVIDAITDVLSLWQAAALAFVSGFTGSIVARLVLGQSGFAALAGLTGANEKET